MSNILIVEDNTDIAVLYQRALMQHQNTVASSAEDATRLLDQQHFDLIILDMHLPERSGLYLLEFIRHHSSSSISTTKVFVISADDLLREPCRALGIQAWMTKPIELDELMTTVHKLLSSHH
ncbi:MAG: response regulator [Anaerolineales bacterium]|nr:response regulator [Anaerolineales bacterium]